MGSDHVTVASVLPAEAVMEMASGQSLISGGWLGGGPGSESFH